MNKIYTRMDAGTNQQFHAKKSLGQNFLVNRVVIDRIINASHLEPQDIVIEIGPGQGVLTQRIAPRVEKVFAIEKDRFLIEKLNADFNGSNVEIVHGDFLEFDLSAFDRPVKIVGNVPYNISTPIITKILENRRYISRAYFTLQLEFAERLVAKPHSKTYGAISCFVQYHAGVEILFKIKNSSFKPLPKVDSCFVSLNMSQGSLYLPKDEGLLFKIIRQAFMQRRKTIVNALQVLKPKDQLVDILTRINIPVQSRPEDLSLEDYLKVADHFV